MNRLSAILALGSLCIASAALATTYVRVEKDGTKTYSDRPMPGGQPVDVQPAQTYSATPVAPSSNLPREQRLVGQYDDFKYQSCAITPANDTTFNNPESVNISANYVPALRYGDVATMTVDGQTVGGPDGMSHTMSPVYRGSHTVVVTIKNVTGQVMCTASSTFHVIRPGLNSPARKP
jgi:hypothetical protein